MQYSQKNIFRQIWYFKNKIQVLHNASSLNVKFKYYTNMKKKLNIGYFGSIYRSRV